MAGRRTEVDEQLAELLRTAKDALGLHLSFVSRFEGGTQHLDVVESRIPFLRDGITQPRETSFCQLVLDGRLPSVIPDVTAHPEAMRLPAARIPRLRSYVSVPIRLSDGSIYGTFCAAGLRREPALGRRDEALLEVLARAAAVLVEPVVADRRRRADVEDRLLPLLEGLDDGPVVVVQPIVDLATGRRTGAEALSRFPQEWALPPDACFAQAHDVGLGHRLELHTLTRAAALLDRVPGYLGLNVSPAVLLTRAFADLVSALPLERVLLELSEHDPVEDYDALSSALGPLRARGLRLAIDDVGAGFSSLRHIVLTTPDVIKLDRSIVAGVGGDRVLRTLVGALVTFAHDSGSRVVAEGIETDHDAAALLELGVDLGQGWYLGRPGPVESLREVYPVPGGSTPRAVAPPRPRTPPAPGDAGVSSPAARPGRP